MNIEQLNLEYKNKMDALMEEYRDKAKEIAEEEEPFIKKGQGYFIIDKDFKIDRLNYDGDSIDRELLDNGNMFPYTEETEDKIKKEVKLIAERRKLQSEMEMFARQNNEGEIDWNNYNQIKWYLYVDCKRNNIITTCTYKIRVLNTVYFTSEKIVQKALDKFSDRIRKLYKDTEE